MDKDKSGKTALLDKTLTSEKEKPKSNLISNSGSAPKDKSIKPTFITNTNVPPKDKSGFVSLDDSKESIANSGDAEKINVNESAVENIPEVENVQPEITKEQREEDMKKAIKDRDKEEVQEVFDMFSNGRTKLSSQTCYNYLRKIRMHVNEEEFHVFFRGSTVGHSEEIGAAEFCYLMKEKKANVRLALEKIFKIYNEEYEKYISSTDFRILLSALNVNNSDIEDIVAILEDHETQRINYEDLIDIMLLSEQK